MGALPFKRRNMDFYGDHSSYPATLNRRRSGNFYRPHVPEPAGNGLFSDDSEDISMSDVESGQYPIAAVHQVNPNANDNAKDRVDEYWESTGTPQSDWGGLVVNQLFLNIVEECQNAFTDRGFNGSRTQIRELREYLQRALDALGIRDRFKSIDEKSTIREQDNYLINPRFLDPTDVGDWYNVDDRRGWRYYHRRLRPGLRHGQIRGGAAPGGEDEKKTISAPWTNVGVEWSRLKKDAGLPVMDLPTTLTGVQLGKPLMYRGRDMTEATRNNISQKLSEAIATITPVYEALASTSAAETTQQRDIVTAAADEEIQRIQRFKRTAINPTGRGAKRYTLEGDRNPYNVQILTAVVSGFFLRACRLVHVAAVDKLYKLGEASILELIQAEILRLTDLKLQEEIWREYDGFLTTCLPSSDGRALARRRILFRKQIEATWDEDLRKFRNAAGRINGSITGSQGSEPQGTESDGLTKDARTTSNKRVLEALQRIRAANVEARDKAIEDNDNLSDGDVGNHQQIRLNNADIMAKNNTIFALDVEIENARGYDPLAKGSLGFGAKHRMTAIPAEEYWRDSKRIRQSRQLPRGITSMSGYGPLPGQHPVPFIPNVFASGPDDLGVPLSEFGIDPELPEPNTLVPRRNATDNKPPTQPKKPPTGTTVPPKPNVSDETGYTIPGNDNDPARPESVDPKPDDPTQEDPTQEDPIQEEPTQEKPTQKEPERFYPISNWREEPGRFTMLPPFDPSRPVEGGWTVGRALSNMREYNNLMPKPIRDDESRSLQVWSELFSHAWGSCGYGVDFVDLPDFGNGLWTINEFKRYTFDTFKKATKERFGIAPVQETLYYESLVYAQAVWLKANNMRWILPVLMSGCAIVRTLGPGEHVAGRYILAIARFFVRKGPEFNTPYQRPETQVRDAKKLDARSWSLSDIEGVPFEDYFVSLPQGEQRDLEEALENWRQARIDAAQLQRHTLERQELRPPQPSQPGRPPKLAQTPQRFQRPPPPPPPPPGPGQTQPGWDSVSNLRGPRQWTMEDIANSTFENYWGTLPAHSKVTKDRQSAYEDWLLIKASWDRIKDQVPKKPAPPPTATFPPTPNTGRQQSTNPPPKPPGSQNLSTHSTHPSTWSWDEWKDSDWNTYWAALTDAERSREGFPESQYYIWRKSALQSRSTTAHEKPRTGPSESTTQTEATQTGEQPIAGTSTRPPDRGQQSLIQRLQSTFGTNQSYKETPSSPDSQE
ncbi:hypothetical protein F5B19DRAFT_437450 [Rostrohypoxylon terebratum]|nr:hypothetical protein F5B19DRAFT_437450 [Rostrohypoxylon terebratum]